MAVWLCDNVDAADRWQEEVSEDNSYVVSRDAAGAG
jgi:hypothetical protein